MQCPRCQAENRVGRRFCGECGLSLALTCPACGFLNEGNEKFCGGCGAPMTPGGAVERTSRSPQSYTPKHLAERILTSKAALEGERKQVTVLFADLKASMELLADRDPEEARKILDPVLEMMMEAVHRYEGTVNQVMGDGIMALFGAPIAHEDHALRACYAALRMQETVKRYADRVREAVRGGAQIRIGLNSGEVVVRAIGSDLHMDYTAVGQTTHLAARMEQLAVGGTVLITSATYELVEPYVRAAARGLTEIKGLAEPVPVFELIGASGLRTRFQTSLTRGLSPLVGRDAAISELRSALAKAVDRRGQVVAMPGEPGIGKSRLLYEFIQGAETRDWLILEARAFSYSRGTPYLPLIDLLKAYFQIQDRDDAAKIGQKISDKLAVDEAASSIVPPIYSLLGLSVDDSSWAALEPRARRQRTLDAVRHALLRESCVQPVLVIIEDLHWIDTETQAFLDALVETLLDARIVLLVNYRPEYVHSWASKPYYRQLNLASLSASDADALLAARIGRHPSVNALKTLLYERTHGNPLFLEECVRSLIESHALIRDGETYRVATEINKLRLPPTVHAIVAARIDRLEVEDKALLQAAAVIGKEVPWTLLCSIVNIGETEIRAALSRLQYAELIVEGQLFPDLKYVFRHAVIHEVAYDGLLQDRRRTLHAEVLQAIETRHGHRLTEHLEALGYHALRSERWEKAVVYFRLAAEKARASSAHTQAIEHLEHALQALARLPENAERQRTYLDLRLELRSSLYVAGELGRSIANLDLAETVATTLGDTTRLAWILAYRGEDARLVGDLSHARACLDRARSLAANTESEVLEALVAEYSGMVLYGIGEYRESLECFRASEAVFRNVNSTTREWTRVAAGSAEAASIINQTWLARVLAVTGQFDEAVTPAEKAVASAKRSESPYAALQAAMALGDIYRQRGEWVAATKALEQAQRITQEREFRLMTSWVDSRLGVAYVAAGHPVGGLQLLRNAVANLGPAKRDVRYSLVVRLLGEGCALVGELEEALARAKEAKNIAETLGPRGEEALADWLLAYACAARGLGEESERHFFAALTQASVLGMRPLVAHCHLGLSELYRRRDNGGQAYQHLTTAKAMYREMGMTYWLEKAEAELAA